MFRSILRRLSDSIYHANVRLRLQALGLCHESAAQIVEMNRRAAPDDQADLERVVKIVGFLVAHGWVRPAEPDHMITAQDVAAGMAFCLAYDGGRALAEFMAPDQWAVPNLAG